MRLVFKGKVLTSKLKKAETITDKLFGLLIHSNPRFMVLNTRFGIHTVGLTDAIDVVVLNKDGCVMRTKQHLQPYRWYFWNPKFNTVLELPGGTINKFKIQAGDLLIISC